MTNESERRAVAGRALVFCALSVSRLLVPDADELKMLHRELAQAARALPDTLAHPMGDLRRATIGYLQAPNEKARSLYKLAVDRYLRLRMADAVDDLQKMEGVK